VPDFGLEICVCRSLLPPIGHNAPFSVATSSRQNRLDRVVEVLRPLLRGRAISPAKGHMSDKRKPDQTFGPLLGSFGNKESRQRIVERQLCTLISDEFDFRFPSAGCGQPGSKKKLSRCIWSATRECWRHLRLPLLDVSSSAKFAAQRVEDSHRLSVMNLRENVRKYRRRARSPMWRIQTPRSRMTSKSFVHNMNSCAPKQGNPLRKSSRIRRDAGIVGIGKTTYVSVSCHSCDIVATTAARNRRVSKKAKRERTMHPLAQHLTNFQKERRSVRCLRDPAGGPAS